MNRLSLQDPIRLYPAHEIRANAENQKKHGLTAGEDILSKERKLFVVLVMAAAVCFSGTGVCLAGYDYEYSARGHFEAETSEKLTRGITNASLGWMEMFHTPVHWGIQADRSAFSAFTLGFPYGIMRALGRTVVGVYEIATCYAPQGPIFYELQGEVR